MTETYSNFHSQWRSPLLKLHLITLLCVLSFSGVCANTAVAKISLKLPALDVSGRVVDEAGKSMPGVNILVKGTSNGTTTDTDGAYRISVQNADAVLVFSFI